MKFINREDIEIEKWDALVRTDSKGSVFSLSAYLDAVAENWCIWTNSNYTKGIAIPFTIRIGFKIVYTPIFVRYCEWFGEKDADFENAITRIKEQFKHGNFSVKENFDSNFSSKLIFQNINYDQTPKYNTLAKRMFSKFDRTEFQIETIDDHSPILQIIRQELPQKIASINEISMKSLEKLIGNLKRSGNLKIVAVKEHDKIVGGIFLVENGSTVLYLKGAFSESSKKEGAMYELMHRSIENALQNKKIFDFGGSRIDGVRRFNVNLGGEDQTYYSYDWDMTPFWFRWLKKARKSWKKK